MAEAAEGIVPSRSRRIVTAFSFMLLLTALALLPVSPPTFASGPACGDTITSSTILSADIGPCAVGLIIGANGITLDCRGHTITGTGVSAGVSLTGISGATIKKCKVTGFDHGFDLLNADFNRLTLNTAFNNGHGFFFISSSHNKLELNRAVDNAVNGFYLLSHSDGNLFRGNLATGHGGQGFFIDFSSDNILRANKATHNVGGFQLNGGTGATNNILRGNKALTNVNTGFYLGTAKSNHLRGNIATDNGQYGYYLSGSASDNDLISNQGNRNGLHGFLVDSDFFTSFATDNTLGRNRANHNGIHGFFVNGGKSNLLYLNHADSNSQFGYFEVSSGTANTYLFDKCAGNLLGGSSPVGLCSPQP